jgi:hypothetical protein
MWLSPVEFVNQMRFPVYALPILMQLKNMVSGNILAWNTGYFMKK